MHIDAAVEYGQASSEDDGRDFIAADHLSRFSDQFIEQGEFNVCQVYIPAL